MVTRASANATIILVVARHGAIEHTKRNAFITLSHITHVIVCVNKMDLVYFKEFVFNEIFAQFEVLAAKLLILDNRYILRSAPLVDN